MELFGYWFLFIYSWFFLFEGLGFSFLCSFIMHWAFSMMLLVGGALTCWQHWGYPEEGKYLELMMQTADLSIDQNCIALLSRGNVANWTRISSLTDSLPIDGKYFYNIYMCICRFTIVSDSFLLFFCSFTLRNKIAGVDCRSLLGKWMKYRLDIKYDQNS